jgi:hypothetical protein
MDISDVKCSIIKCKHLESAGYDEFKFVGNYMLINKDTYSIDMPKEIKLYIPRTPWSLRQLVNRKGDFVIESKRWLLNGLPSRIDNSKPAEITYYKDGSVRDLKWFNNKGHYHRTDGKPAIVRFSEDGMVDMCFWLAKGQDFSDKVEDFCQDKGWDRIRLNKDQIEVIKSNFFTKTNYI